MQSIDNFLLQTHKIRNNAFIVKLCFLMLITKDSKIKINNIRRKISRLSLIIGFYIIHVTFFQRINYI